MSVEPKHSVTYSDEKTWKKSRAKRRRSYKASWVAQDGTEIKSFRNLSTCRNVTKIIHKSGWESYVGATIKLRLMGFSTCPSDQVCPPDQLYEQIYKIKVDQGEWGRRSDLSNVDPPRGWEPWSKQQEEPTQETQSLCPKSFSHDDRKHLTECIWRKLEPILREHASKPLKEAKNNRLEAWISDCALMVCEASDFDLQKLGMGLAKYGVPVGSWRKRLKVLAFRRRAVGRDIGEDVSPGKFQKQLRHASEKFWAKVPANDKEETCPLEEAQHFATFCLSEVMAADSDEENLIKVFCSIIKNPEYTTKDRVQWIKSTGFKMSERTYYRTLNSIRARLTIGGLFMMVTE